MSYSTIVEKNYSKKDSWIETICFAKFSSFILISCLKYDSVSTVNIIIKIIGSEID